MVKQPQQEFLTLEEVTRKYEPAYYDTWDAWWNDQGHATSVLIESLCEELRTDGHFQEPVILCAEETVLDDETGEEEFYPASVGNGMHRLAAHHRTGIGPVLVQHGFTPVSDEEWQKPMLIITHTRIEDDDSDVYDEIYETLSWRHKGDVRSPWLSMEFGSGSGNIDEVWLYGGDPTQDSVSRIEEDAVSRIGHLVEVLGVRWQYFDEEGEETDYVNPEQLP